MTYCEDCGFMLDDNKVCGECSSPSLEDPRDSFDAVDRPFHYNHTDGIECIDYIKQVLGTDGFVAYCHGNFIKYQHRYRYKRNPVEDMEKAQWYLSKMLEALKETHR